MEERLFSEGDTVKMRTDSQYFGSEGKHGHGTITNIGSSETEPLKVVFEDGYSNNYGEKDLTKRGVVDGQIQ